MGLFDLSPWTLFLAAVVISCVFLLFRKRPATTPSSLSSSAPPADEKKQDRTDPLISTVLRVIEEEATESWETVKSSPKLSIFRKITGDSPVAIVKAKAIVEGVTPEDVMQAIWDVHVRTTWDSVMKGFREVEVLSSDSSVITFFVKPPIPLIAARDFVQLRSKAKLGNAVVIAYQSVEHPDAPQVQGFIRGETLISGYRIEPQSTDTCCVEFISQTDIKGLIPVPLLNSIGPLRAADWIHKLSLAAQSLRSRDTKTQ